MRRVVIERGDQGIEVTIDDRRTVTIVVAESLRTSSSTCIADLAARGLPSTIMTGDKSAGVAKSLAPSRAAMTPAQKFEAIRSLDRPLYVGDGVNDAPALAAAHASIALAGGSTLAVATASATLHGGDLSAIPRAIDLSRFAVRTIRSNLRWAIAYNLLGVAMAATGWLHPVIAAVLMGVSSAIVSFRAFRDAPADITPKARTRAELKAAAMRRERNIRRALVASWMLQGMLLIPILSLSAVQALLLLAAFAIVASIAMKWYVTFPAWLDMTLAMVAVGGVGMNFGWWADLGFQSPGESGLLMCCATAGGVMTAPWMYIGMIALGTPAMYLLRRTPELFSWKNWCCVGPLVLGIPAMVGGMWIGSIAARTISISWPWQLAGLLDAGLMLVGMAVGMLLPCSIGNKSADTLITTD